MLRCDAGLLGLEMDGRTGGRGRSRRVLALVSAAALALGIGAVTAAPASAFAEHTSCDIEISNSSSYSMQLYDKHVNGSGGSIPSTIPAGGDAEIYADSWYPVHNHCSIDLKWELQTPDGKGWSQGLEMYVYDPNSGSNSEWSSATGDFAARTTGTSPPYVSGWGDFEDIHVGVCDAQGCPPTPYGVRRGSLAVIHLSRNRRATVTSAPGLRVVAYPLSHAPAAASRSQEPKQVPSLLHRGDLIGRGWQRVTGVEDLGRLGKILKATKAPASCQDKNKDSEPSPLKEGVSAFAQRSGAEFIGAGQAIYADAGQARRTIDDAVSPHTIGCLARLFTSKRFHTRVHIQRRSVTFAGRHLILSRLTIRTRSGARITATDYIDVIGVLRGNANALLMFASNTRPPERRGELTAINAVVGRLR